MRKLIVVLRTMVERRSTMRRSWLCLPYACYAAFAAFFSFHDGMFGAGAWFATAILCLVQLFYPTLIVWFLLTFSWPALILAIGIGGREFAPIATGIVALLLLLWCWPKKLNDDAHPSFATTPAGNG